MQTFQLAMRGRGHINEGIPCQDKTAAREALHTRCIVLADGAGSARLSHIGAAAVVETTADLICQGFEHFYKAATPGDATKAILAVLHDRLRGVAKEQACDLADLASTLLFAACNGGRYIIGQLGDGCIAFSREGRLKLATKPEKGGFANVTYFITSARPERHFRLFKGTLGNIDGFLLMSDGAAESLYQRNTDTVAPLVGRLITATFCKSSDWLQGAVNDIFSREIIRRTTDDCSIAVMPLYTSYMDLFGRLGVHDIYRLFYKGRYRKTRYTSDYVTILSHADQTDDIATLSKLTGLSMDILERRFRQLRRQGFKEIRKFRCENARA